MNVCSLNTHTHTWTRINKLKSWAIQKMRKQTENDCEMLWRIVIASPLKCNTIEGIASRMNQICSGVSSKTKSYEPIIDKCLGVKKLIQRRLIDGQCYSKRIPMFNQRPSLLGATVQSSGSKFGFCGICIVIDFQSEELWSEFPGVNRDTLYQLPSCLPTGWYVEPFCYFCCILVHSFSTDVQRSTSRCWDNGKLDAFMEHTKRYIRI